MRLIQFESAQSVRHVGVVEGDVIQVVNGVVSMRELALSAIRAGHGIAAEVLARGTHSSDQRYADALEQGRVLPPLDHEDSAHCLVSGTGLTHLGSASTRDKMHQKQDDEKSVTPITDSAQIFQWGIEGGRPEPGTPGVQPEWFYKGNGSIVVRPGQAFQSPAFAQDTGEEPELTGLYVIGDDGKPYRIGFALGNEFSDHVMERRNYLYLAHSKLRNCSYGPELRVGPLPRHLAGTSRIHRNGEVLWEKEFLSGEDNMCHSIENLEYHHFKYQQFLCPGDVHVHFFGTATLSFADNVKAQPGDVFEISLSEFGAPLRNGIEVSHSGISAGDVKEL
ncbi:MULTISPECIES: AraD1 family protein [unclassified Pseudomonas]|uniref:AraD1 family protein n=1 Tax=unclassified Pseudomonas TaxID=196821 RepID=UPI002AC9B463|nr:MULTISPECIES: AraD1 family protein [unclassified Pseudomonas]MEB0041046.1 GguC family protein [Pseudomonas sp. MH10]MEB0076639.1 GguC family protein [Pseudomonas sp. MH10out]MEB0090430.1 GguC family protein [Pseudomonas sp. CCI4.2]MEB0100727.1 GguC family protein [Pseudomonas sp. CCI3.2]MEB0120834.1 GguC family protein [Pseudomonas sp. CCI1.2]